MAEKICSLKKSGSSGETKDNVFLILSANQQLSSTVNKCVCYTDDNNVVSKIGSVPYAGGTFFTISGNDFSGTYRSSTNSITVKKGGKYQINDNGTITTVNIPDNGTISVTYKATTWSMMRI